MRTRTDSRSRCTWWWANISARCTTSRNAISISCMAICGSGRDDLRSPSSALPIQVSRSMRGMRSMSLGGALEAFVFLQAAHEIGARITFLARVRIGRRAAAACAT